MKKVLVLGNNTTSVLSAIRSLSKRKIDVDLAVSKKGFCTNSNCYSKLIITPNPKKDSKRWIEYIKILSKKTNYKLIIPVCEEQLLLLNENRRFFEKEKFAVPSNKSLKLSLDKYKTFKLAEKLKVSVPKSKLIKSYNDFEKQNFNYPLVLKPIKSVTKINGQLIRRSVQIAEDKKEAEGMISTMINDGPVIAQDFFYGTGIGQEFLAHEGEILCAFQHERVHEPIKGGGSLYRKSVPLDNRIYECSKKIIEALNFTGVLMIEYKQDSKGEFVLIEINPRFWGSLPLSIKAGIDFPYLLFELFVNKKKVCKNKYKKMFCRNIFGDLRWMSENKYYNHNVLHYNTKPWKEVFFEFLNIIKGKENFDIFSIRDPLPFIYCMKKFLSNIIIKIKKKLILRKLKFKKTFFYKSNLRSVLNKINNSKCVFFICHGNKNRSPFAAEYFRKRIKNKISVLSFGLSYRVGQKCPKNAIESAEELCPKNAIESAEEFGIDLKKHKSKTLSKKDLKENPIIFLMDLKNYVDFNKKFPDYKDIFFLGILNKKGPITIKDPDMKSKKKYKKTFKLIKESINLLFENERKK